jgi:hypothetical protein
MVLDLFSTYLLLIFLVSHIVELFIMRQTIAKQSRLLAVLLHSYNIKKLEMQKKKE